MGRYRGRILFGPTQDGGRHGRAGGSRSVVIGMAFLLVVALVALAASSSIPAAGPALWLAAGATLLLIGWLTLVARVFEPARGSR